MCHIIQIKRWGYPCNKPWSFQGGVLSPEKVRVSEWVSEWVSQQCHFPLEAEWPVVVRPLLSSKRRPHFKTHRSLEGTKFWRDPIPRITVLTRASSNLLDWTVLYWTWLSGRRRPSWHGSQEYENIGSMSDMRDNRQPAWTGAIEHGSWGIYIVRSRYQVTSGEDVGDNNRLRRLRAYYSEL
jgi:hypothetical protein